MANNNLKKCIGIILSSRTLVAIEMINKKGNPEVLNYSKVILEDDIVENNSIVIDPERFKEALKQLLANGTNGPIKTKQIFAILPEQSTFEHHIVVPQEKINDIEYIKAVATDYIPIELDDAVFDFVKTEEDKEKKETTLRFIATQSSIVKPLISILKEIGLEVIGIKIDVDCLLESFTTPLNHNEGDIFVLNMDTERDLISLAQKNGKEHRLILRRDQKEIIEALKSVLRLNTDQDYHEICLKLKRGEKLPDDQAKNLKIEIAHYTENLEKQIRNVIRISKSEEDISISKVYLTGLLSGLPGIREIIEKIFPNVEIKNQVEFAQLPEEIERDLLEGLGTYLSELEQMGSANINLLPETKKEELSIAPLIPKFKRYFFIISILLGILILRMGIMTTSTYISYRIKAQEAIILNEHALNPYLMSIAKLTQERQRLHDQILSVLDNAIPVSILMESLDEKNKEGINYQNISYTSDSATNEGRIELQAEIENRQKTEAFVESLEADSLYSEVISPLSNLLGKEERLVRIDLSVNEEEVTSVFEKKTAKAEETSELNTDNEQQ